MMSSLYIGASGMRSLGEGMSVITNNLSNVNTVGFKQSMMLYGDSPSQYQTAPSNLMTNISQKGQGVRLGTVRTLFTQGGFETSNTVTDIGISGKGYYGVQKDGNTEYTRAGNFRFTKEGDLVDPSGYNLMGHKIVNGVEESAATPIKLDFDEKSKNMLIEAKATSSLVLRSNLGGLGDLSNNAANPFFAVAARWDGTQAPPLGGGQYGYADAVTLYDANGNAHTANIFYDKVATENGRTVIEYVVGASPGETASAGQKSAGLFMAGTLTFDSQGQLVNMSAYTPSGSDPSDLNSWKQASLSGGIPSFTANFAGSASQQISLDFGLHLDGGYSPSVSTPADASTNSADLFASATGAMRTDKAFTGYGSTAYNTWLDQDGYPDGTLKNLVINGDGVVSGRYSNGQSQDLYRIGLYRFTSEDGLKHVGNNHFLSTEESGPAAEGKAGTQNYGTISGNSLEQSNVDYAREFSQMIVTQRGFQMNSKVVTTSDQMLQKALEIKR